MSRRLALIILIFVLTGCTVQPHMSVNYLTGSGGSFSDSHVFLSHPF